MNYLVDFLVIILAFYIESSVLSQLAIFNILPNLSLVIVVVVSLLGGKKRAKITGLGLALIYSIVFGHSIAFRLVTYYIIIYIISSVEIRLSRESLSPAIIGILTSTVFYNLLYSLYLFFGRGMKDIKYFLLVLTIESLYNVVLTIIVYKILLKVYRSSDIRFTQY